MRFLVASDSHGRVLNLLEMLRRAHTKRFPADGLIFLGDGLSDLEYLRDEGLPLFPVIGNCDFYTFGAPKEDLLTFEGHRIFISHGDRHSVKSGVERITAYGAAKGADIILYGHTHVPLERYFHTEDTVLDTVLSRPTYVLCPGSIREGRDGFEPGFGVLEISERHVLWNRVALI